MPWLPEVLTAACGVAVAGLLAAERLGHGVAKAVCKTAASTAFVGLALSLHATGSAYGQAILAALALSWVGDVCLLSERSALFLSGLGFFLLGHLAFSAAFAAGALDLSAGALGLGLMAIVSVLTLRWLWPNLGGFYRVAVTAYVLAIAAMCTLAVAHGAATGGWSIGIGALLFAASDISVARDRFVAPGFVNRAWGLPAYYAAQLLLAWSVAR
jgi:uncharacterized membrane protein YhhN